MPGHWCHATMSLPCNMSVSDICKFHLGTHSQPVPVCWHFLSGRTKPSCSGKKLGNSFIKPRQVSKGWAVSRRSIIYLCSRWAGWVSRLNFFCPPGWDERAAHDAALASIKEEKDFQACSNDHWTKRVPCISSEESSGEANDFWPLSFPKKLWKLLKATGLSPFGGIIIGCVAIDEEGSAGKERTLESFWNREDEMFYSSAQPVCIQQSLECDSKTSYLGTSAVLQMNWLSEYSGRRSWRSNKIRTGNGGDEDVCWFELQ